MKKKKCQNVKCIELYTHSSKAEMYVLQTCKIIFINISIKAIELKVFFLSSIALI